MASLMLSASILFGSVPFSGINAAGYPGIVKMKGEYVPSSFDSYEITLADGVAVSMSLSGGRVLFSSVEERSYEITLSKCSNNRIVRNFSRTGDSFDIEIASSMNEGELYYLTLTYDCYGSRLTNGNNIVFRNGNDVCFWKNDRYDYNLKTCSELMTDRASLEECLEPQNDIECDSPVLIAYSDRICEGAADDWEKVYRFYDYIAHEMAYDNVEADDDSKTFQDGAIDLLRDGKGICEGFANAFVALCRAQGIPAVVEFGLGYGDYYEMTTRVFEEGEYADHAWAAVFLGGKWHFVDPTYDMAKFYYGPDNVVNGGNVTHYYLLPLESFSNDHLIQDADTRHGIPSSGFCGHNARYEITRDGVCYISGSGTLKMPAGVNGFHSVVFTDDCTISNIGKDCFDDNDLITTVILPETVRYIQDGAFNSCEDLEYVYIPEGCQKIGSQAFDFCDELSYIRVPDSVTKIGSWAFDDCPRLYVSIPSEMADCVKDYALEPMYIERR